MAKAKQRFSWQRNAETGVIKKIDSVTKQSVEFDLTQYEQDIQDEIFVYGGSKIFDDRLSQVPANLKIQEAKKLDAQFLSGKWKAERVGGIHLLPVVIDAIVLAKGCSVTAAQTAYRKLDDEERIILKENLADQMAEITEARKESEEIELDDLLS